VLFVQVDAFAFFGVNETMIDGITDSAFVIFDFLDAEHVVFTGEGVGFIVWVVHQVAVGWSVWEFKSVLVTHGWVVSSLDWFFPVEDRDGSVTVGQAFHVVTSQQLLVDVVVQFSATILVETIFFTTEPEWVVQVEVVVESVKTYIFVVVAQFMVFWVSVDVPSRVIGVDVVFVFLVSLVTAILHFVFVSFVDDFAVDEVVWVDFVDWWENKSFAVITVEDSNMHGIYEHTFVDVFAGPACGLVEGFEILGVVEDMEQSDGLVTVFFVEDGEYFTTWQKSLFVEVQELLYVLLVSVLVQVLFDVPLVGDFGLVLVVAGLEDVFEETEDVLLSFQEHLVSNFVVHAILVNFGFTLVR